jgi:hypothetical protein
VIPVINIMRGLTAAVLLAGATAGAAAPLTPADAKVYATGLEGPRGIRFGADGFLYVAEAGLGGSHSTGKACQQVPTPVGPYTGGMTARISKVSTSGKVTTVASGFPSAQDAMGDLIGVADVAFMNGTLYAVVAGGGCSHGNPTSPTGIAKVNTATGKWTLIANIGAYLKSHPAAFESADDFEPDGTLYSLISVNNLLYTVEPNHGQVFSVTAGGGVSQLVDISASEGHVVPTSIAALDGNFYVGNLDLFPIDPQWARVMTIAKDGFDNPAPGFGTPARNYRVASSKAGFTTVVAVDFGPDGLLYVLELSAAAGFPTPGEGMVVRVKHSGEIETVISGLVVPTGMTFGPDNRLYVSNFGAIPAGALPPGSGQILQFDVPPGY